MPNRALLLTAALLAAAPAASLRAQVVEGAVGVTGGVLGGGVVTLGAVVARAWFQEEYLLGTDELLSLQGTPLVIGPAIGLTLTLVDPDAVLPTAAAGTGGFLIGAAAGAALGHLLLEPPEGRWAGEVMGAAVGVIAGTVAGIALTLGAEEGDGGAGAADASPVSIPVGFTLSLGRRP